MTLLRSAILPFILLAASAASAQLSPTVESYLKVKPGKIELRHVRIIDGTGGPARNDQDVILAQGKIASIAASGGPVCTDCDTLLDLAGRTIFPGIVGMHDHLYYIARPDADSDRQDAQPPLLVPQMTFSAPRLYLASGVTTLRTTGSVETYTDLNLKRQIELNQLPGPHLDVTGPYLEGEGSPFIQMHQLTGPQTRRRRLTSGQRKGSPALRPTCSSRGRS